MASEEIFQSKAQKTNQQEQKTSVCHREVCTVFPGPWEAADPVCCSDSAALPKGVNGTNQSYVHSCWMNSIRILSEKKKKLI